MKTQENYRFFNNDKGKYMERIEKDGSICYFRFFNRETKVTTSCVPVWGRQEFEAMWNHIGRTD